MIQYHDEIENKRPYIVLIEKDMKLCWIIDIAAQLTKRDVMRRNEKSKDMTD